MGSLHGDWDWRGHLYLHVTFWKIGPGRFASPLGNMPQGWGLLFSVLQLSSQYIISIC